MVRTAINHTHMNIIFQIDGGMGKCIAATAVCKAIKEQYPKGKLFVISGYPAIFLCNPYVDRALQFGNLHYFYEEHVEGQEVKMMAHNPYVETSFVNLKGHLIQVWCEMFGLKHTGDGPKLFINNREQTFFANQFGRFEKPILLLHTNGGGADQAVKYSWMRDMPLGVAQQVVNYFANDYHVVHIRRKDQLALQNTTPIEADFRALAVLIQMSAKRLFIDSFAQHAAAALDKPSVVVWIGNSPAQFGYGLHTNIIANAPTIKPELRNSVYTRYNISGTPTEFPYNHEGEIFNVEEIIAALKGEMAPQLPIAEPVPEAAPEKKKKREKEELAEAN